MISEIIFSTQGNKALLYFDAREIGLCFIPTQEKNTISEIIFSTQVKNTISEIIF